MVLICPFWATAFLVWVLCWTATAGRHLSNKDGDALITTAGQFLIAFAASTCLLVFSALPRDGTHLSELALWVHHAAFFALFVFLATAQYFLFEALWKLRNHAPGNSVAATYRRLWILTELLPAPIALTIFITGLRLVWEAASESPPVREKSPAQFWLASLIFTFGVFFWDGILGYTPLVHGLYRRWITVAEPYELNVISPRSLIVRENLQLTSHFVSWPGVFLLGLYQWRFDNPVSDWLQRTAGYLSFLPRGFPELCVAVVLWMLAGLMVLIMRRLFGRLRT